MEVKYQVTLYSSSFDYSDLIEAILRDDRTAANELSSDLMNRVIFYLKVRLGAPQSIAEECAYQAFSDVFEMIKNDKINDKKSILKYFTVASRNEYLRFKKIEHRTGHDPATKEYLIPEPAEQLLNLIDDERQKQLKKCLKQLPDVHQRFILTFFSNKIMDLQDLAKEFNYSYAKTRTLKTRIIQTLQECVNKLK